MSVFSDLLWDKPASTTTYDVRSPVQATSEKERLGVGEGLTNQYAAASGDPNFGIAGGRPSDAMNRYFLDQSATDAMNRLAASGAGGSGYAASVAAARATKDYFDRQNALSQTQNAARANTGGMMVNATSPSTYTPYQSYVNPPKPSILSSLVNGVVGGGAGGAGAGAGQGAGGALSGMMGGGGGGAVSPATSAIMTARKGGTFRRPTDVLVGEEGPEVLRLGAQGADKVIPMKKYKHGMGVRMKP